MPRATRRSFLSRQVPPSPQLNQLHPHLFESAGRSSVLLDFNIAPIFEAPQHEIEGMCTSWSAPHLFFFYFLRLICSCVIHQSAWLKLLFMFIAGLVLFRFKLFFMFIAEHQCFKSILEMLRYFMSNASYNSSCIQSILVNVPTKLAVKLLCFSFFKIPCFHLRKKMHPKLDIMHHKFHYPVTQNSF